MKRLVLIGLVLVGACGGDGGVNLSINGAAQPEKLSAEVGCE